MIVESLIDLFFSLFGSLFFALDVIQIPTQAVTALYAILDYGNWVVGVDILALFVGTVVFWWGVHLSIGLAVWLWEHLPLT